MTEASVTAEPADAPVTVLSAEVPATVENAPGAQRQGSPVAAPGSDAAAAVVPPSRSQGTATLPESVARRLDGP